MKIPPFRHHNQETVEKYPTIVNALEENPERSQGTPIMEGKAGSNSDCTSACAQNCGRGSGFQKTKKIITKQLVSIEMILHVTEYQADVYRNSKTGEKVHAAFPAGVVDDVNYDGSIKSLLFLLNTDCAVSIDKSQRFLSDLTGGKLKISRGMINKLCREFSSKTETERKKSLQTCCPVRFCIQTVQMPA